MGRGWKRKTRKELRKARLRSVHANEGIGSAAGGCSGNNGDDQRQAGVPAEAAAVAPVGGRERSGRYAAGAAKRDATVEAAHDSHANAVSASSGEIRLLRRVEVPAKDGGLLARARAGEESANDRHKCRKIGNSAAQRVNVAKLIKDDLQAYSLRTSEELLSAFLGRKSSIRQLFSSCQLHTAEPHFHEMVLAAFDRVIGDLFFAFRQECLNVLSAFTTSTYFATLAGSSSTLAALSVRGSCQLVLLLSLAAQEKIMSVDQARYYLKELETSAQEKCYGSSVSSEPVDWSAVKRADDLLNWEEQSLSFEVERKRALKDARRSMNRGPRGISQAVQLTEQECEPLSRGHRASASLLPSNFELRYGSAPQLCSNRLDGRYRDVDEYIDTHFFLLRENFVGPLRKAVQEFVQLSNQAVESGAEPPVRLSNARLYGKLTVVRSLPAPGQFVFKVRLSHGLAHSWIGGRLLIKGSLVALSADRFDTIVLAMVVGKEPPEHGSGNLIVDIIRGLSLVVRALANKQSDREAEATFSMIESATYYEEYRHNAEALQRMEEDTLPFRHHLITDNTEGHQVTADSKAGSVPQDWQSSCVPCYLMPKARGRPSFSRLYDFNCLLSPGIDQILAQRCRSVDVLDSSQWPAPEHTGLDASQAEALRTALCSDLAVIQGPPGTGKTYIGIKIVSMLLANSRAWSDRKPAGNPSTRSHSNEVIAVICYTNHALDQFLELILDRHPDSVVRIGERSTNPRLDSCNIKRLSSDFSQSRPYRGIKRQLDAVERLIAAAETRGGAGCSMRSLTLKDVSRYLETRHAEQFRRSDDWSRWLDCHDIIMGSNGLRCEVCSEHEGANTDDVVEPSAVALCKHLLKTVTAQIEESRVSPLKMTCSEMLAVDNVWKLPMADRWRMYRYLAELYWQGHSSELEALAEQRNNFLVRLQKLRAMESMSAFRGRKIVGATVTGAIKHRILMNLLKPKIVIVEEAAEILEANLLAAFTRHCEHLILIGDHQQLRPKPEMYELSLHYRMDVSLFERLVVHRGMKFTQLQIQRRMRPEISNIVRKGFYDDQLRDHESVEEREPVRGLARNVFFVQHTHRETSDGATKTFVNEFEAKFAVELWRYLLRHGYERRQMTILVPYVGQLRKLQELLGPSLPDVRLTTIDNYQGEENDIIILCLVRSNTDGTIGFVGESNRICVALSRARLGFFCFGNFTLLSKKSPKWKAIVNLLTESGEIGPALPLYCYLHGQQTREARTPEDISSISNGGCSAPCNAALLCGHVCQDFCHYDDPGHRKRHKCQQKCLKSCQRGQHDCGKRCSDTCGPCYQQVLRSFAECGHQWEVPCFLNDRAVCMHPVTKPRVRCGRHEVDSTCHFSRCSDLCCSKPGWLQYAGLPVIRGKCYWLKSKPCLAEDVYKYPGCGHQVAVSCHALTCVNTVRCTESIFISMDGRREKALCKTFSRINCPFQMEITLHCDHTVRAACSKLRRGSKDIACTRTVRKKCDLCGSEREVLCGSVWPRTDCKVEVDKQLACGHTHRVECGKQNQALICTQLVKETRPICGHKTLERRCCDDAASSTKPCMEPVDRFLDCKHTVEVPCSSDREATVLCESTYVEKLKCGHYFPRLCRDRQSKPMCPTPVKVERNACTHHEIVPCHEQHRALPACSQRVEVKLPSCGHTVSKPCSQPIESVLCDRLEARRLGCDHKKKLMCYEATEDATCLKLAARRSPCDHAAKVSCHALSCKTVQCSLIIRLAVDGFPQIQGMCHELRHLCTVKKSHQLVLCGHEVEGACSAKQADLLCAARVHFGLPCGHHVPTYCHAVRCNEQGCSQTVSEDGRSCTMLKSELTVCTREAEMDLPCGHKVAAACHVSRCAVDGCPTTMTWRGEEMPCHRLRAAALATECYEKKTVDLPCGHQKSTDCCDVKECRCNQSGISTEHSVSSHNDTAVVASPSTGFCQIHSCAGYQTRKLNCGHTAKVPCRERLLPVRCSEHVEDTVSLCGHSAQRPCGDRTSTNLRCTSGRCEMWCWHGGCQKRCAEPCEPCTEPCAHGSNDRGVDGAGGDCGHRKSTHSRRCRHLCFQPCPVAPCPMPCNRPLPCGHDCRGLCGEACPALCLACPGPLLERVCRRYNVGPAERFLRLMPCNDIVPVAHMDAVVTSYRQQTDLTNGDTLLTPLLCPSCRSPVGYCRRYDEELKRYFNLKRKVPTGADGQWIGCARGHVRRREEKHCDACAQLRLRAAADPSRRLLPVGIPVRFRCAPVALQVKLTDRPLDELIGEVYSLCNNDHDDDAAELVVKVGGKFVVTVAGNVTACTE